MFYQLNVSSQFLWYWVRLLSLWYRS